MRHGFDARRTTTPDGVEWRVGRQWLIRRPRRSLKLSRAPSGEMANVFGQGLPVDVPESGVLAIVGLIVLVLIAVPLLLFGIELVVVGCLLAASLLGHVLLGRPWVVQATITGPPGLERVLEWRVSGWRRSHRVVDEVVSDLRAGREPDPQSAR